MHMSKNIQKMLRELYKASRHHPAALIVRHSIRETIYDARNGHNVPLTPEGKDLAYRFGQELPNDRIIRLFPSPVPRCQETAEQIAKGIQSRKGEVVIQGEKGFLGCTFMKDPGAALALVNSLKGPEFIKQWFEGGIDRSVMDSPDNGVADMIRPIMNSQGKECSDAIDIFVSHDWNIIILNAFTEQDYTGDVTWPDYLEGILVIFKQNDLTFCSIRRARTVSVEYFKG